MFIYISRPQAVVEPNPNPQNWSFSAQKSQSYPKFGLKSKVRIDGILENSSCSAFKSTHNHLTEPYGNPKNSPIWAQKSNKKPLPWTQNSHQMAKNEPKGLQHKSNLTYCGMCIAEDSWHCSERTNVDYMSSEKWEIYQG